MYAGSDRHNASLDSAGSWASGGINRSSLPGQDRIDELDDAVVENLG